MNETDGTLLSGVRALDHTADVGLEIQAPDLPELFRRAALGTMWLVLERPAGRPEQSAEEEARENPTWEWAPLKDRSIDLVDEDIPGLFRSWLRTLLFWEEVEGFVTVGAELKLLPAPRCETPDGQGFSLQGKVRGVRDGGPRVREIKGVTLHGLEVSQGRKGWTGRVIFDV